MGENELLKGCFADAIIFTQMYVLEDRVVSEICAESNIEPQIHFLDQETCSWVLRAFYAQANATI